MTKQEQEHKYIEEFALIFEKRGFPRMAGRILALLMISDPPEQSFQELVEKLDASKSSVSTSTRLLVQFLLIDKISRRGERRDYFRIRKDVWNNSLYDGIKYMTLFRDLASKGLEVLAEEPESRKDRLQQMERIYGFLAGEMPKLIEKWEKKNKEE
jgi:DNA-binding transcriptional regulator GbsR (MarR family)